MAQTLADFLTNIPLDEKTDVCVMKESKAVITIKSTWTLYNDDESSRDGPKARFILISSTRGTVTYALHFDFECSNNEVEYEVLIIGLQLAFNMEIL